MSRAPKRHSLAFKAQVALEAIKQRHTVLEIAAKFQVHQGKKQLLDNSEAAFAAASDRPTRHQDSLQEELSDQIGQLQVELTFMKKMRLTSAGQLRDLVEPDHAELSLHGHCELLELNRSSLSYEPPRRTSRS